VLMKVLVPSLRDHYVVKRLIAFAEAGETYSDDHFVVMQRQWRVVFKELRF
jgi:hypothetical protein